LSTVVCLSSTLLKGASQAPLYTVPTINRDRVWTRRDLNQHSGERVPLSVVLGFANFCEPGGPDNNASDGKP